jgi:hypothetical protein
MNVKQKLLNCGLYFFPGTLLLMMFSPLSFAGIFLSTDIPVAVGSGSFEEGDILYYEFPDFASFLTGEDLGIPKGVNLDAFAYSGDNILFSVDIPVSIGGEDYTERDLILYDGDSFSKLLDGDAAGIPKGASIDAATVLTDGSVVISLDVLAYLGGRDIKAHDLVRCVGASCDPFFAGSDSDIPEGANLDGVMVITDEDGDGIPGQGGITGDILFSLDIPTEVNGLEVTDKDIVRCGQSPCYNYFDELASQLPINTSVDAFSFLDDNCPGDYNVDQEDSYPPQGNYIGDACDCEGNFDCDSDCDGSDAFDFKVDFGRSPLGNPCESGNPCNGDFDCDNDCDGSDAFIFKEDFGRSPLGNPCPNCVTVPWCVYP